MKRGTTTELLRASERAEEDGSGYVAFERSGDRVQGVPRYGLQVSLERRDDSLRKRGRGRSVEGVELPQRTAHKRAKRSTHRRFCARHLLRSDTSNIAREGRRTQRLDQVRDERATQRSHRSVVRLLRQEWKTGLCDLGGDELGWRDGAKHGVQREPMVRARSLASLGQAQELGDSVLKVGRRRSALDEDIEQRH